MALQIRKGHAGAAPVLEEPVGHIVEDRSSAVSRAFSGELPALGYVSIMLLAWFARNAFCRSLAGAFLVDVQRTAPIPEGSERREGPCRRARRCEDKGRRQ